MSEEKESYTEFVRTEVDDLLMQAQRLRELAEKWERDARGLCRSASPGDRPGSTERSK